MRGVLGILLLSDVSFKSTYPEVHSFPIQRAGLAPMNTSVINHDKFNLTATAEFWWYFPALTTDVKRVKAVTPLNCTNCDSYFIPGSMASIVLDPSQPIISQDDYPNALAYIQTDAPGYQIDFYPIDRVNDPYMTLDDCRVYGVDFLAIQICLKETNGSMLVGNLFSNSMALTNSLEFLSRGCRRTTFLSKHLRLAHLSPIQYQNDHLATHGINRL